MFIKIQLGNNPEVKIKLYKEKLTEKGIWPSKIFFLISKNVHTEMVKMALLNIAEGKM